MLNKYITKYRSLPIQVKASFWFFICSFLQKGISVITTPIFTRLLTTAEYGRYNVFNSWLSIVTVFVTLNLYHGVYIQGLVKFSEERNIFSSSLQGLTLTVVLIWTILYFLFSSFWNNLFNLTTVQMISMLLMIWASSVFNYWAAEQRVLLTYGRLVIITLLVSLAKPIIGIIFVMLAEDKVTARILGLTLVEIIGYTGLFFVQMNRGKVFFSKRYWKYALMLGLSLIPHYLSSTVLNNSDRIMIEQISGGSESGIYSLAYSVSMIMTLINTALSQAINPWIYQKIKNNEINDIARISYVCLIIVAVANIGLIAFAPEVIAIFAPPEYYDAIWVIPPVAMSVYFMFAYGFFANFEFYYEKTSYISIATGIGAIVNIILNYIFINIFGYYAAGYTTLLCYILYAVGHYFFMTKICREYLNARKPYDLKILTIITILFLTFGFLLLVAYKIIVLRYLIIVILFVSIFYFRKLIYKTIIDLMNIKK